MQKVILQVVDLSGAIMDTGKKTVEFPLRPMAGDKMSVDVDVPKDVAAKLARYSRGVMADGMSVSIPCEVQEVRHSVYMSADEDAVESMVVVRPANRAVEQAALFVFDRGRCKDRNLTGV